MTTIRVPAKQYEDHDDCLAAAAADVAEDRGLEGYELNARWDGGEDGDRDVILLDVPARVLTLDELVDTETCAHCQLIMCENGSACGLAQPDE